VQSGQQVIGASHHQSIKMAERVMELREIERYRDLDRIVINYEKYCEELKREGARRKLSEEEREQQKRFWVDYCYAKEEKRKMELTEMQRQEEKRAVAEKRKKLESQKIKSRIVNWAARWKRNKEEELKVVEQRGAVVQSQLCGGAGVGVSGAVKTGDVLADSQYEWDVYDYGVAAAAEMLKKRLEMERVRLKEEEERKRSEVAAWERWNNDLLVHGGDGADESYSELGVKCHGGDAVVRERGQKRRVQSVGGNKNKLNVNVKKARVEVGGSVSVGAVEKKSMCCGCVVAVLAGGVVAAGVASALMQWL